jgi:hypothetical protein
MENRQLYQQLSKQELFAGIEGKIPFVVNKQGLHTIEHLEFEDPPEPIHTVWGLWLHQRDPIHSIDQRYDTEHVLRSQRWAEDILHYYHYVPVIDGPDHEPPHEVYESNFEYEYHHQELIYDAHGSEGDEELPDIAGAESELEESVEEHAEAEDELPDGEDERDSGMDDFEVVHEKKEDYLVVRTLVLEVIASLNRV